MEVRRGELFWVDFDPVKGSEQGGLRPALVVQQDVGNQYGSTTIVAAITRSLPARPYPFVTMIDTWESGLPDRSAVNCSQLATIQKDEPGSRLRPARGETQVRPIGKLSEVKMAEVDAALKYNLGLT